MELPFKLRLGLRETIDHRRSCLGIIVIILFHGCKLSRILSNHITLSILYALLPPSRLIIRHSVSPASESPLRRIACWPHQTYKITTTTNIFLEQYKTLLLLTCCPRHPLLLVLLFLNIDLFIRFSILIYHNLILYAQRLSCECVFSILKIFRVFSEDHFIEASFADSNWGLSDPHVLRDCFIDIIVVIGI